MKGKGIIYIVALAFAALLSSCENGYDCYLENIAYNRIGFYKSDSTDVKYQLPEVLTVSLMINGKDSIVVNHIEYADALQKLAGDRTITAVIADPSAASFIETLRRKGWRVIKADNDVLTGIRHTSDALKDGRIVICEGCEDCLREMEEYVWDLSSGSKDRVCKAHDHAMDDMRYFVSTVLGEKKSGFAACSVERRR